MCIFVGHDINIIKCMFDWRTRDMEGGMKSGGDGREREREILHYLFRGRGQTEEQSLYLGPL